MESELVRRRVREKYARTAPRDACCPDSGCCARDYTAEELTQVPAESYLGLGSGNPVRPANLQPGETVLDLGSGAGVDAFLAARRVGPHGRVVGIDLTPAMVERARRAAERAAVRNVEFRLGEIERLPFAEDSFDVVLSNCVVNLSPDKPGVFREAFRVLRPGGRLVVSDIVQERDLGSIEDDCGCVAIAMRRDRYLETIRGAGFRELWILEDRPWRMGPDGRDASAITLFARKTGEGGDPVIPLSLLEAEIREWAGGGCCNGAPCCAEFCRLECGTT